RRIQCWSEEDHLARKCVFTIFGTLMVLATASSLLAQNVASKLTNLPLIADGTSALTNPGFSGIFRDDLRSNPPRMPKRGKRALFSRGLQFPQRAPSKVSAASSFLGFAGLSYVDQRLAGPVPTPTKQTDRAPRSVEEGSHRQRQNWPSGDRKS